jgi:prepilin-type N-terminal cleavage/methylation domain-containing protein
MRVLRSRMRRAFTMLELIFVIVIMGILAKFGVDLFMQIYESYTRTTITASLMSKTEAAVGQIANRLTYRVRDSVIASNSADGAGGTFRSLSSAAATDNVFEWIGLDSDGWDEGKYSGIIDLNHASTTYTQLKSPATEVNGLPNDGALLFVGSKVTVQDSFGWHGSYDVDKTDLHVYDNPPTTAEIIPFTATPFNPGDEIFEFYQAVDTAYALVLDNATHELYLRQGYQPWQNETYPNTGDLLVDNVKTFTLQKAGDIIKIELCLSDDDFMGEGEYSICKTKIVF